MLSKSKTRLYSLIFLVAATLGAAPMAYNVIVDPYRMHGLFDLGLDKERIATKKHGQLYKAIEYPRLKSSYLVLGDSRARALRNKLFHQVGFTDMYNFAYSGGTLPEMVETFWYAAEHADLKGVVLSVPLRMMTTDYYGDKNLVPEAIRMANTPFSYYRSLFVAETGTAILEKHYPDEIELARTAFDAIANPIGEANAGEPDAVELLGTCMQMCRSSDASIGNGTGRYRQITTPIPLEPFELPAQGTEFVDSLEGFFIGADDDDSSLNEIADSDEITAPPKAIASTYNRVEEAKWDRQIEKAGRNDWQDFAYSEHYVRMLEDIVEYSNENGIKVAFFIPPTHTDMQQRLVDFDMTAMSISHRKRMAALAPVFDFDLPNETTNDRSNFTDGYHFRNLTANGIAYELMRYFGADEKTVKLIEKRRKEKGENILCPINANDPGVVLPGSTPARLGNKCIVWGEPSDA